MKLADLTKDMLSQTAEIWNKGWHQAHASIVPEKLVELRTVPSFRERLLDRMASTRIGVVDDTALGFYTIENDELYQFYVAPEAQRRGVGQTLMQDFEHIAATTGHHTAWLSCSVGNDRAARFYEKTGWQNKGVVTVDLETSKGPFPLPVWRFEKSLPS